MKVSYMRKFVGKPYRSPSFQLYAILRICIIFSMLMIMMINKPDLVLIGTAYLLNALTLPLLLSLNSPLEALFHIMIIQVSMITFIILHRILEKNLNIFLSQPPSFSFSRKMGKRGKEEELIFFLDSIVIFLGTP